LKICAVQPAAHDGPCRNYTSGGVAPGAYIGIHNPQIGQANFSWSNNDARMAFDLDPELGPFLISNFQSN